MHKKNNNKLVYKIAASVFIISIVILMFSGLVNSQVPFIEVKQANLLSSEELKNARIFGTVAENGIKVFEDGKGVRFTLMDSSDYSQIMEVEYVGLVPDTFKAGAEIYVEGIKGSSEQPFAASNLITKCPSKYQKENRV